ncbi:MAG: hypothetical protein O2807_14445 [bacterium]|nr:hypothetical protein [bacterium]
MNSPQEPAGGADAILKAARALYGVAAGEKTREGAKEMAALLARLSAAPVGDDEEPMMPVVSGPVRD